jgi:hypothetical protein
MKRIFLLGIILSAAFMQLNAQGSSKRNYVIGKPGSISTLKIDGNGNINVTLVVTPNESNERKRL